MSAMVQLVLFFVLGLIAPARASELGRLFFSADERRQLDQQHVQKVTGEDDANAQSIIVNGIIQHGNGIRTVWINGKAQRNAPGKSINAVPVTVPGKSESIEVKVGQHLLFDNLPSPDTDKISAPQKAESP